MYWQHVRVSLNNRLSLEIGNSSCGSVQQSFAIMNEEVFINKQTSMPAVASYGLGAFTLSRIQASR